MLIRYLVLICLLFVSAMPICAAEVVSASTDTLSASAETIPKPIEDSLPQTMPALSQNAMTMEDALDRITVSAEDWLDGDTYYIRYTFTNPTSVAINKKVNLTTVSYTPYKSYRIFYSSISQCNDELTCLTILPYSKYEATISFLPTDDATFYRIRSTGFHLEDGSVLQYQSNTQHAEKALYTISAGIRSNNELFVAIRNRSFFNTITAIDNLSVWLDTLRGYIIPFAAGKNLQPVNIGPRETAYFSLFPLDPKCFANNNNFIKNASLYKKHHEPISMPLEITLDINHIPHYYSGNLMPHPPALPLQETTALYPFTTNYIHNVTAPPSTSDSTYILDKSYLYAYIQMPQSTLSINPNSKYLLELNYFTQDRNESSTIFSVILPTDMNADVNDTKYFLVRFPLPNDFYIIHPASSLYFSSYSLAFLDSNKITLRPTKTPLLPVPADHYTQLDATPITSSDNRS